MAKYVLSYRVSPDFVPSAETTSEWEAFFGGLGPALLDVGHAVVAAYGSLGEVGGSDSKFVGYSLVEAEDLESALTLAKDCPALRVGGGVEVGPVM